MNKFEQAASISTSYKLWKEISFSISDDLKLPKYPSLFSGQAKTLCESKADLICTLTTKPSSG